MNSFLESLKSSIDVIDTQIEFDRVFSAIPVTSSPAVAFDKWIKDLKDFGLKHQFTKAQASGLMSKLLERFNSNRSREAIVTLLELILSLAELSRDACFSLFETPDMADSLVAGLSDSDVFVKYNTIKLLRLMYSARSVALVASLLRQAEHIRSLTSLLSVSTSDFVRNECLRFIGDLVAESNPDLSPFLVFQGVPEALLDIFIEQAPDMPDADVSGQVVCILEDFIKTEKSCRYIKETGCLNSRVEPILLICLQPVLDHAAGIADPEDSNDDDPDHSTKRIHQGWVLASEILQISSIISPKLSAEIFSILETCGSSPLLGDVSRGECFGFIAGAIAAGANHTPLVDLPYFQDPSPLIWRVFPLLVDERAPLAVRIGIDKIFSAACASPDTQQIFASMMGIGLSDKVEDEFDPRFAYIENSPSRMITSILVHSTENVTCRISDSTALASQIWFSLSAVSHICRSNPEIQKSMLFVKMSENGTRKNLLETVFYLSLNRLAEQDVSDNDHSGEVVSTAATLLLIEWLLASPQEVGVFVSRLEDTKFFESMIRSIESLSANNTSSIVSVIFLICFIAYGEDQDWGGTAEVIASTVESKKRFSEIFKILSQWNTGESGSKRGKKMVKLPFISGETEKMILRLLPDIKQTLLRLSLGGIPRNSPQDQPDSASMIEALSKENESLRNEITSLRKKLVDWKSTFSGPEKILNENERLQRLVETLKKETEMNEVEIARIELLRDAENEAMKQIINEQETQIHQLAASYNQLIEVCNSTNPEKDMKDLLDLLKRIHDTFPQTRELITGRRSIVHPPPQGQPGHVPPSTSPSGPITSPFMRRPVVQTPQI